MVLVELRRVEELTAIIVAFKVIMVIEQYAKEIKAGGE